MKLNRRQFFAGAGEFTIGDVISACRRFPMVAEKQLVLLREAQALDKRSFKLDDLCLYLKQPSPSTILVITSFFIVVGFNETPFFPSSVDMNSSMTIYNSSASEDVLRTAVYIFAAIIVFGCGFAALIRWGVKRSK